MKKLALTLSLIAITLLTACSGNKKADANGAGNDSIAAKTDSVPLYVEEEDKTDYSKFVVQPTRIDTTVGDWEIHIREFYDGKKFKLGNQVFANYSLKVNIFKGGKPVFKGHKIDAKAVAGSNYIKDFTLGVSENVFVTETTVYLDLSYCEPETDNCQMYILAFCANGQVRKVQTAAESYEGDMDGYVFDVYDFYAMYVNELTQPQPNKAAIQKVLNKYCTKGFAQKMQSHTSKNNPLLGSGKFEFQWLRSFIVHSKEAGTNSCIVHYEIPGGKKVYKCLLLQKKPGTAYDFVISDVLDATENDLPSMQDEEEEYAEDDEI